MFFIFAYQYPKDEGIDPQTDNWYSKELREFHHDFRIVAMKRPYSVEDVIWTCRNTKPDGVGNVFGNFYPFLANISKSKIDKNTWKPDNTEF